MTYARVTLGCYALAGIAQLTFIVGYWVATRGAWRRSLIGVQLMSMAGVIAATLTLAVGRRVFGEYPGRQLASALLSAAFLAVSCVQVVALVRERRADRSIKGEKDDL